MQGKLEFVLNNKYATKRIIRIGFKGRIFYRINSLWDLKL